MKSPETWTRSLCVTLLAMGMLAGITTHAVAQFAPLPLDEDLNQEPYSARIDVPRELRTALDDARRLLESGQPLPGLNLLQTILDQPEDFFIDETLRKSVKQAAVELLLSQPASVRESYEVQHSAAALQLKQRLLDGNALSTQRELFRRYPATAAGRDAMIREARLAFDDGRTVDAGRWWDLVAGTPEYRQTANAPLQHSLAWLRSDRPDLASRVLQQSRLAPGSTLKIAGHALQVPAESRADAGWILQQLPAVRPQLAVGRDEWLCFRGDATHNSSAGRTGPVGPLKWQAAVNEGFGAWSQATLGQRRPVSEFDQLLLNLVERLRLEGKLVQPAAHPLVYGDTVLIRSPFHLTAYDLKRGTLQWRSRMPGSALADAWGAGTGSMDSELAEGDDAPLLMQTELESFLQEWTLRNQTAGQLAASDRYVYAVEQSARVPAMRVMIPPGGGMIEPPRVFNSLVAYERDGGRMVWQFQGERTIVGEASRGTYFLGPPLCLDNELFCLMESDGEIRLSQFRETGSAAGPRLIWSQVLAAPRLGLANAVMRRLGGLTPAAADNLLICPTSSGLTVAIDPLTQQLVWGYEYPSLENMGLTDPRQLMIARIQGRAPVIEVDESEERWLDSAPTIASGYVLLTPRDSAELHCLDAITGELVWKRPREQGLYVAGVREQRVILVSRDRVEALQLQTGKPAWNSAIPILEPAGRGLFVDRQYLLPLQTGEILTVDWEHGQIRMRTRLQDGLIPGNLAGGRGTLVSQGLFEVIAFEAMPAIEQRVADTLSRNPRDAQALALRGELKLHQGEDAAAIADLRQAIALGQNPHASLILVDLFMSRLRRDFPQDRTQLDEMEQLIEDDHQRTEFLSLTARGFEQQGNPLAAFRQYLKLSSESLQRHPLVRVSNQLTVRRDRLISGHLQALFAEASPQDQQTITEELRERLRRDSAAAGMNRGQLLEFFRGLPFIDNVRLQTLANKTPEQRKVAWQEWLMLANSPQQDVAVRAMIFLMADALQREAGSEANLWKQRLEQGFATVENRPGQTVEQWLAMRAGQLERLAATQTPGWPDKLTAARHKRQPMFQRTSLVEVLTPRHPLYGQWIFEFQEGDGQTLTARDARGRRQWSLTLPGSVLQNQVQFNNQTATPQLSISGANFALMLGTTLVLFEIPSPGATPRITWHRSLLPELFSPMFQPPVSVRAEFMRSGRRRVRAIDAEDDLQIGQLIGLTEDQVVYQVANRVIAADPVTGSVLWTRFDIPRQCEGTLDRDSVVLLDTVSQDAWVLRAADGDLVRKGTIPDAHSWIWFQGSRLLTWTGNGPDLRVQLLDLLKGEQVWSRDFPVVTRCAVVSTGEVACLNAKGDWQVLSLADGRELSSGTGPAIAPLDYLWVQAEQNGYLVIAGAHTPPKQDFSIVVYDGNQVPVAGQVCFFDKAGKQPLWSVELPSTAFHIVQPASVPILAFAARQSNRMLSRPFSRPLPDARPDKLSALFVDRRTGEIVYESSESPPPGLFQCEIQGDDSPRLTANFVSFEVQFTGPQPEDKAAKAETN